MVASYINILKSSANFSNVFRGTYENQRMVAANVVPSTSKIKIPGSEFKLIVSIFRKLEEIIISNRE